MPKDPSELKLFIQDLVKITDNSGRSLVHQAAVFSSYKIMPTLLRNLDKKAYSKLDSFGMDLLELACVGEGANLNIQPAGNGDDESSVGIVNDLGSIDGMSHTKVKTNRFKTAKVVLEFGGSNLRNTTLKELNLGRRNTPLHWAIHWGDAKLSSLVFRENPLQAIVLNQDKLIPFEMIFRYQEAYSSKIHLSVSFNLIGKF